MSEKKPADVITIDEQIRQVESYRRRIDNQVSAARVPESMPKYQAHFRIKVDIDTSSDRLRAAGLKPRLGGGRPSGTPGEAQIILTFDDPTVSALISKSLVQISSPSLKQIYSVVSILQRHLVFEPEQPSLLASLYSIHEPQAAVYGLKKQLVASELKKMEFEEKLQKLTDILLTLNQDLSSLHVKTQKKIRPILKRALDDYCGMFKSHSSCS